MFPLILRHLQTIPAQIKVFSTERSFLMKYQRTKKKNWKLLVIFGNLSINFGSLNFEVKMRVSLAKIVLFAGKIQFCPADDTSVCVYSSGKNSNAMIDKHISSKHQILLVTWIRIVTLDTARMANAYVLMTTTTEQIVPYLDVSRFVLKTFWSSFISILF